MDENSVFSELESRVKQHFVVSSTGSIAAGKSSFLSALHAVLNYDSSGIKLEKEHLRDVSKTHYRDGKFERRQKGVFRTNATLTPDSMPVYGMIGDNVYSFRFYAPGGHPVATNLDKPVDCLLYMVDLMLAYRCGEPLNNERTLRWGEYDVLFPASEDPVEEIKRMIWETIRRADYTLKKTEEVKFGELKAYLGVADETVKTNWQLAAYLFEKAILDFPPFGIGESSCVRRREVVCYKGELGRDVIESAIRAHKHALSKQSEGIPVFAVGTHWNQAYGNFPSGTEAMLTAIQANFNNAVAKLSAYQKSHGIQTEEFSFDFSGFQEAWRQVELYVPIPKVETFRGERRVSKDIERYVINNHNKGVLQIAYDSIAAVLSNHGISPEGLGIVSFREGNPKPLYCRK